MDLERAINVSSKSTSTLIKYGRHPARLALLNNVLPTELDNEQVLDYLHLIKANGFLLLLFISLPRRMIIQRGEQCMVCAMPVSCAE